MKNLKIILGLLLIVNIIFIIWKLYYYGVVGHDMLDSEAHEKLHQTMFSSKEHLDIHTLLEEERFWFIAIIVEWMLISIVAIFYIHTNSKKEIVKYEELTKLLSLKNKKIMKLYKKDELTNAYNRYAIREWFEASKDMYSEDKLSLSVIYMDLDKFKRINDIYGHKMGDIILKEFSELILSSVRKSDYFCRWGGEEFILFCSETSKDNAIKVTETIMKKMKNKQWSHKENLTCSFGVTELKLNESLDSVLNRADKAMYEAKKTGRNKYIVV